jgi:hypothetical protein
MNILLCAVERLSVFMSCDGIILPVENNPSKNNADKRNSN